MLCGKLFTISTKRGAARSCSVQPSSRVQPSRRALRSTSRVGSNRHAYIVAMACYDIVILFIIRSARVRHAHAWHVRHAAGVERVFSAAGKMHDKSMKDSTLEHSLFAAFNIERAIINPPSSIKTSHQHRKDISAVLSVWLHYPLGMEMWGW